MEFRARDAATAVLIVLATSSVARAQSVQGVDVSYYQGNIDWGRVKASGVGFGICRVSDGLGFRDPKFQQNWQGMRAQGLVRGVYQFFRPNQDPTAQADLLCNAIGGLGAGDLPAVCDVEALDGVSGATLVARVNTWCNRVRARTGRTPIVYTSPGFWPAGGRVNATLWVAHWGVSSPRMPSGWSNWAFWQYTSTGVVPGIPGRVDRDVFHGTLAQLHAFANGSPPPGGSVGSGGGGGGGGGQPTLTLGARGGAVSVLQTLLAQRGFSPGPIDGDFGPRTLAAVKAFQRARGLAVDGVVGPHTWGALASGGGGGAAPAPSSGMPTLRIGSRGAAVVTLQQRLAAKGFSPGAADGVFGPRTDAAVRAFQRSRRLVVDGVVGPQTWGAL